MRILLLIETSRAYGRKLLRGIAQYALINGPWQMERQAPFYLQGSRTQAGLASKDIAGFDGIIMREQKNVKPLIETGIPVVFASYLTSDFDVPTIRTDDKEIASAAVKYFFERGFEHFAFAGYDGMFWSDNRKAAFDASARETGFSCVTYSQPKSRRKQKWEHEKGLLSNWLRDLAKPVALLACNDDRAQQVLAACQLARISVPEEVAIMGIDNDEFICTLSHPPLSSVSLSLELAGYEAASVLDRMIQGEKTGNVVIPVHASNVITRQSSDILAIKDPIIAQTVQFIGAHVQEPIQISDVLDHVAISRRSLYDRFKQAMGSSLHRYIKEQRIERIEHLLLDTEMTISQIAYHMGFNSDEHIATYFRSVKGVNPHAFRASRKLR